MADMNRPTKRAKTEDAEHSVARIAVVGAGSWSQGWHLPHLQRNARAQIAAIVEPAALTVSGYNPNMKPAKDLAEQYGVPLFSSFDELLKSQGVAASLSGVIIASNHQSHHELGMKAIKANLHVLIEKPMTTDVPEARELAELALSTEKTFIVNTSANFRSHAIEAQKMVAAGEVGDVEHVSCYMMREREFFDATTHPAWVKPSGTMLGNGFAWGQLSHTLSWVFFVTGLSPQSVFCHMGFSKNSGADLYDSASVKCTNGATICVQGAAAMPGPNAVCSDIKTGKLIENKIFGTEGCIFFSGDDAIPASGDLIMKRHDGRHKTVPGFYFENTSQEGDGPESMQAFLDGCLGKSFFNASDAKNGLKVVQTLEAMYRSAMSGSVEKVL